MSTGATGPAFRPISVVGVERRPQPRRGRLLGALIAGLVVVVFGFAAVFLMGYRPVEAASALTAGRFADEAGDGQGGSGPVRLRFVPGRGTTVGLLLRNTGELTIKLEGVELAGGGGVLRQTKTRLPLGEASRTVVPEQTQSFRSVGLDPGKAQWVVLVLRFGRRCPPGTLAAVGALRVRYSVFELRKRMRVGLRDGLQVRCPADERRRSR